MNPRRIAIGSFLGLAIGVGGILALTKVLATPVMVFQGEPAQHWREDLTLGDLSASNHANALLNTAIIPKLSAVALEDTHDPAFKLVMVDALNALPGVRVRFRNAPGRRADAVDQLGKFGPAAWPAIPVLIQILKGHDKPTRYPAVEALGEIHTDPDVSIPALIACLEDSDLSDSAAEALGKFGPQAKDAAPKLLQLLLNGDKEDRRAALLALPKIDPETAAKAGIAERTFILLQLDKAARTAAVKAWAAAEKRK